MAYQFIESKYVDEYDASPENSYRKQCVIDEEVAIVDVLDSSGWEDYSVLREQWIRENEGFLCVYSISSRRSFDEITTFYQQILRVKGKDYFPCVIVANKCDLENDRQVSTEEGKDLAKNFGCKFFEVSAKLNINVDESFYELFREIRKYQKSMGGWNLRDSLSRVSL